MNNGRRVSKPGRRRAEIATRSGADGLMTLRGQKSDCCPPTMNPADILEFWWVGVLAVLFVASLASGG